MDHYYRNALEREIGTTTIAALTDLHYIALIDANESDKAKRLISGIIIQDIRFFIEHYKDKGEIGRTAQEALRRVVKWREQHSDIKVSPDLEQELQNAGSRVS